MPLSNPLRPAFKTVLRTNIPLGDSITQGNSALVNGLWNFGNSAAEVGAWRARMKVLRNSGIAGQQSSAICARLQSDVLAYNPDSCTIMSGTNDVLTGYFGTPARASYMNYIEQMVTGCLASGVYPLIVVPPAKTGCPDTYMNRYFYYMLAEYYGLPLVDWCTLSMDVHDALGGWINTYSIDGVHPNAAGIEPAAEAIAAVYANPSGYMRFPYLGIFPETTFNAPSNMLYNGNFVHQTGGLPDGWTVNTPNATVTFEPAATYPLLGQTMVYTKTDTAAAYMLSSTNVTAAGGNFAPGDTILFSGHVATSNMGAYFTDRGLSVLVTTDNGYGVSLETANEHADEKYFATEFVVPPGAAILSVTLVVSQTGTYRTSNLTLLNKSFYQRLWQPGKQ